MSATSCGDSGPASDGTARPVATATPRSCRCRTTAVFSPEKLNSATCRGPAERGAARSAGGGLRSACVNRGAAVDGVVVALAREPVDRRAARIAEAEQPRHLVVRLARRIVARAADELIHAGLGHEVQARVAARDDQHRGGQRNLAVLEKDRLDVAGQMMHGDDRACRAPAAAAFANDDADEQRADEAGPLRHRERVDVVPADAGVRQRALDDAADVAHVLPRRDLRHDTAPLAMDVDLRRDHVRADPPRPRRVAGRRDDGGGGLVAGGLDAEDNRSSVDGSRFDGSADSGSASLHRISGST